MGRSSGCSCRFPSRRPPRLLREAVEKHKPQIVLSLGLAGGRSGFSLERIAVNLADARIPDNEGHQPRDSFLYPGEETAYLSTLPLRRLLNEEESQNKEEKGGTEENRGILDWLFPKSDRE